MLAITNVIKLLRRRIYTSQEKGGVHIDMDGVKERKKSARKATLFFKQYFYVYIATNPGHTLLVSGLSGSLSVILIQWEEGYGQECKDCSKLVYWERFTEAQYAINRESKIRKMSFRKKVELIARHNPGWQSLNSELMAM